MLTKVIQSAQLLYSKLKCCLSSKAINCGRDLRGLPVVKMAVLWFPGPDQSRYPDEKNFESNSEVVEIEFRVDLNVLENDPCGY